MKCPTSPKCIAKLVFRVTFGLSLALVGLIHYMTLDMFTPMVADGLGPLTGLGTLWAYILPALQIVGGVLLVAEYRTDIGTWAAGVALGSIAVGMLLKSVLGGVALPEVMGAVNNTLLWLLVYVLVVKCCLCKGGDGGEGHSCASC